MNRLKRRRRLPTGIIVYSKRIKMKLRNLFKSKEFRNEVTISEIKHKIFTGIIKEYDEIIEKRIKSDDYRNQIILVDRVEYLSIIYAFKYRISIHITFPFPFPFPGESDNTFFYPGSPIIIKIDPAIERNKKLDQILNG
jgi:hypothetical protein